MDDKSKQNDFNMKLSDSFIDQERNNYPAKRDTWFLLTTTRVLPTLTLL